MPLELKHNDYPDYSIWHDYFNKVLRPKQIVVSNNFNIQYKGDAFLFYSSFWDFKRRVITIDASSFMNILHSVCAFHNISNKGYGGCIYVKNKISFVQHKFCCTKCITPSDYTRKMQTLITRSWVRRQTAGILNLGKV